MKSAKIRVKLLGLLQPAVALGNAALLQARGIGKEKARCNFRLPARSRLHGRRPQSMLPQSKGFVGDLVLCALFFGRVH